MALQIDGKLHAALHRFVDQAPKQMNFIHHFRDQVMKVFAV